MDLLQPTNLGIEQKPLPPTIQEMIPITKPPLPSTPPVHAPLTTIIKALNEANLPITTDNETLVKELLAHQLPIDKETLTTYSKHIQWLKPSNIETLIILKEHNLPLTKETVQQLEGYQTHTNTLLKEFQGIKEEVFHLLKQVAKEGDIQTLLPLAKDVFQFVGIDTTQLSFSPGEQIDQVLYLEEQLGHTLTPKEQLEPTPSLKVQLEQAPSLNGQLDPAPSLKVQQEPLLSSLSSLPKQESLPPTNLVSTEMPVSSFLSELANSFPYLPESVQRALLQDDNFFQLLQEQFIKTFTLTPGDLLLENSVEDYYSMIEEKRILLASFSESFSSSFSKLKERESSFQQRMEVMKTVQQYFNYLQLPIQLRDQITHGDLYVYRRKRMKSKENEPVSALLHLDMEHLGPLDIYISLFHKEVTLTFYTRDALIKTLMEKESSTLHEAMQESQLTLTTNYHLQKEPRNLVHEFCTSNEPSSIQSYSFDMRT